MAIRLRSDHPLIQDFKKRRELEALELDVRLAEARRKHDELTGPTRRSGRRGRPTSKHLVLDECNRRMRAGWKPPSRAEAARVLSAWLTKKHPAAPKLEPGSIENILREKPKRKRATR